MIPEDSRPASRRLLLPVSCCVLLVASMVPATVAASSGTLGSAADLGAIVARVRVEAGVDFLDLAVTRSDGPCTRAAYSEPVPRMHAASISMLLTATVLMQFVHEGRLRLVDPVGHHLPRFADSGITVADLLTHRSGLRDLERPEGRRGAAEVDRYIASLAAQGPADEGASGWRRADANYNLLGRLLEVVAGQSFADLMRDRLLSPLGMLDSTFALEEVPAAARVQGWARHWGRLRSQPPPFDQAFAPSRGLQTTATDLGRFARAVLAASEGLDDDIITPVTIRRMTERRTATDEPGVDAGLGWQIADTEQGVQWRHGGAEAGFESLLTVYPQRGFAIVVMGNRSDWPRFELEQELRERVIATRVCSQYRLGVARAAAQVSAQVSAHGPVHREASSAPVR